MGGEELAVTNNRPATAVAPRDGTHTFRIRRNHAITMAIAAVKKTSIANQKNENRSRKVGVTSSPRCIPVPAPTRNGAPNAGRSPVMKFTRRFSAKTRNAWNASVQTRIGSTNRRPQRTINAKVALVRVDLPIHRQDVNPGLPGREIHPVAVLVREREGIDQVRAGPGPVLAQAVPEDRGGAGGRHPPVEGRRAPGGAVGARGTDNPPADPELLFPYPP